MANRDVLVEMATHVYDCATPCFITYICRQYVLISPFLCCIWYQERFSLYRIMVSVKADFKTIVSQVGGSTF